MADEGKFFSVSVDPRDAPLRDYLWHGYESRRDFYDALRSLSNRWRNRVGECVAERNGFLRLRFHDTPGGRPDEEWLPRYLLTAAEVPDYIRDSEEPDETEQALDEAFGFD